MPIILIVIAAALATMGLAFLLPDLIGRKPKAKNHGSLTDHRRAPARSAGAWPQEEPMTTDTDPTTDQDQDLNDALWDGRGVVITPDGPVAGGDDW
ncbi:hypothetical protein [Streptomyces sp. NPDC088812]|uniref:hypothetical protein n=1 Tax=Streptomyces sp. NPDC088812 TaxID=3365905 RepID=UPI003801571A